MESRSSLPPLVSYTYAHRWVGFGNVDHRGIELFLVVESISNHSSGQEYRAGSD